MNRARAGGRGRSRNHPPGEGHRTGRPRHAEHEVVRWGRTGAGTDRGPVGRRGSGRPRYPREIHEDATIIGGPGTAGFAAADRSDAGNRPASAPDLDSFRRALVEIEVIGEAELDTLAAGVPASEGILGLARALQKAGRLTAYQAAALYQGKSRGLLIGNYLILDKLGVGGMGVVFKARHRKLGRVVALKILPPSFARDRTAVLRFKREVEAAGRLKHPNIVAALDADEDRGVHFLVMEYVEGRDLDHVVRQRGTLSIVHAIDYLIQAARGLEAAHAEGIVHRDIKPSNLMLDSQGTGPRARPRTGAAGRRLQPVRPGGRRRGPADRERHVHGHRRLHGARAGRGLAPGRPPRRYLQPGMHALLPADGPRALHRRDGLEAPDGPPGAAGAALAGQPAGGPRGARGRVPEDDGQASGGPSRIDDRGDRPARSLPDRGRRGAEVFPQADGLRQRDDPSRPNRPGPAGTRRSSPSRAIPRDCRSAPS